MAVGDERLHARCMITTRVAFAGLSPMCEEILRAGLTQRRDIDLICPWTRLPVLGGDGVLGPVEILFVELEADELPPALRVLMVAAEPLKIVGITPDASRATLFTLQEQRTILIGATASRLWRRATHPD